MGWRHAGPPFSTVGRLLRRHSGDEVAERQVHVVQVVTPARAEYGRVADRGTRVAGPPGGRDLQPGCAASLLALRRVEAWERHPRGAHQDVRYPRCPLDEIRL